MTANKLLKEGKKEGNEKEILERFNYTIKSLNWIKKAAPEYYHSCGFDGDLCRALAMRLQMEGDTEKVGELVQGFPENFVNQRLIPVAEKPNVVVSERL